MNEKRYLKLDLIYENLGEGNYTVHHYQYGGKKTTESNRILRPKFTTHKIDSFYRRKLPTYINEINTYTAETINQCR